MSSTDTVLSKGEQDKSKDETVYRIHSNRTANLRHPKWQDRLLPVMAGILIVLMLFFFISTYFQMSYLHQSILQMPVINLQPAPDSVLYSNAETFEDKLNARDLEIRGAMEAYIVTQRYRQANTVLMAGLWIRYLGFATGMIISLVGASFVLGKLREPVQKFEGKFSAVNLSLRTTSPGIILVVLGVLLMFTTIVDEDYYKVSDGNIYLSIPALVSTPLETSNDTTIPPTPFFEIPTPSVD